MYFRKGTSKAADEFERSKVIRRHNGHNRPLEDNAQTHGAKSSTAFVNGGVTAEGGQTTSDQQQNMLIMGSTDRKRKLKNPLDIAQNKEVSKVNVPFFIYFQDCSFCCMTTI